MKLLQVPLVKRFYTVKEKDKGKTLLSSEVDRINQELYKKGAELVERNKALSLLGAIDEVVLGSIINQDKIAQQVTSLLVVEAAFQIVCIFTYDKEKNELRRIGISEAKNANTGSHTADSYVPAIPLTKTDNIIIQSITERKIKISNTLDKLLFSDGDINIQEEVQKNMGIKSVIVFPLISRNQLIGAMVICMTHSEQELLQYQKELLDRLGEIIGIGMDNALLYNQVQDANEKLKVANSRLQELDKLKNEFVSVASHELRTPMTAIKSYLWMALNDKGGPLNEKQKYYVERGYNSVDRLIRLVNDMLNISRIESGRITIELKSVDLINLTQEVVDEVFPRANELGVTVAIQKLDSLPHVLADSDKIKEVMFNLIGNSLKFTPRGGSITISFAQKDDFIETRITDTGSGIAPEDMGKLFQKFGLIEGSYVTNQTSTSLGTGLGLYICRSIIDLHNGEIHATSEGTGKGSTFSFTLKEFKDSDLQTLKTESTEDKTDKVDLIHMSL